MPKGGGNLLVIRELVNTSGTYTRGDILYSNTVLVSSQITGHPSKGAFQISFTQIDDSPDLNTIISTYLKPEVAAAPAGQVFEDGSQQDPGGGLADEVKFFFEYYGGTGTFGGVTQRKVYCGVGILTGSTGDHTNQANTDSQPGLVIQSVMAPDDIALTLTDWNTGKVKTTSSPTPAPPTTLAAGAFGDIFWCKAA